MTAALSVSASTAIELLADHLWQSTLVAVVVGLLTFVLRDNRAQVRHRLWLAASLKFLVPFGVLTAVGRHFGWPASTEILTADVMITIDAMSRPFSQSSPMLARDAVESITVPSTPILPIVLVAVWLCGLLAILIRWFGQWHHMMAVTRRAFPVNEGREVDTLRRMEKLSGITRPLRLVASDTSIEPGIFGIFRPLLLWPRSIGAHLDDDQLAAIIAHELSHVRRRDNLAAAVHSVIQAVFWFHPLVWWVGARLMDERERSCDEDVIRLGSHPQVYAESILRTCRFSLAHQAVWVSAVTGSDLKRRIEAIMRDQSGRPLNAWRKALLVSASVTAIGSPLVAGMLSAPQRDVQPLSVAGSVRTFEVASVKRNRSPEGFVQLGIQPGGRFTASNVPLRMLIRNAYQLQEVQLIGGPDWITSDRFDVIANAAEDIRLSFPGPGSPAGALQQMLQALLSERFNLKVHRETRELPIYELHVASSDGRLGPQLRPAAVDCTAAPGTRVPPTLGDYQQCGTRFMPGQLSSGGLLMSHFAMSLSQSVQRIVVDRTGLEGSFDIDLTWTPDQTLYRGIRPDASPLPSPDPNSPSIFTAVREQLGLKLDSTTGPVDVVVIDHVDPPTPD